MCKKTVTSTLIAVCLSGCLATEGPEWPQSTATSDDSTGQTGMEDQTATKVQGTALGALIGGAVGALAGDTKGAIIGALAGAGLGYYAGNEVAKRKAQYASEEDFLDAEIAQANEMNKEMAAYNSKLREKIFSLEAESKRLAVQYKSGKVSRDTLIAKRSVVQERLKKNQEVEKSLKREHEIKVVILTEQKGQRDANDPYIKSLEREVAELQANVEALHQGSTQLASIDERLSL